MKTVLVRDPRRLRVMLMGPPCKLLAEWLSHKQLVFRVNPRLGYSIDVDRNQGINHFLNHEANFTHMVMIDSDMVPLPGRASIERLFMYSPEDWISCGFVGPQGQHGHRGDHDASAAACRLSRKMLEEIGAPWFKTLYNEEHTERLDCSCHQFQIRAKAAGYTHTMIGECGHQQGGDGGVILVPTSNGFGTTWPAIIPSLVENV